MFTPTKDQDNALCAIDKWMRSNGKFFYLAGFAGTGKTTLLTEYFADRTFLAPTNKAVDVLRRKLLSKGIEKPAVSTVHKAVYKLSKEFKQREETLRYLFEKLARDRNNIGLLSQIKKLQELPFDYADNIEPGQVIIVDECSMVSKEMFQRLINTGARFIFVGDPFQLPPVKAEACFQAMQPNAMLSEITRQASDNPIIRLSMQIRNGEFIQYPNVQAGNYSVFYTQYRMLADDWLLFADKIITGWNEHRHRINQRIRRIKGHSSRFPQLGEPLVCRFNQADSDSTGMVNGTECECVEDAKLVYAVLNVKVKFRDNEFNKDIFVEPFMQTADPKNWRRYPIPTQERERIQLEYSYAQTVHTAQGSEWDTVIVVDDWKKSNPDYRNWLYTAITRARVNLLVVSAVGLV
jgi:exodeoxyribonuclease V